MAREGNLAPGTEANTTYGTNGQFPAFLQVVGTESGSVFLSPDWGGLKLTIRTIKLCSNIESVRRRFVIETEYPSPIEPFLFETLNEFSTSRIGDPAYSVNIAGSCKFSDSEISS